MDEADDRTIVQLLVDQIEFSNTILLNKCDLVTDKVKSEIKFENNVFIDKTENL